MIFKIGLMKRMHKNHVDDCKINKSMQKVLETSIMKLLFFFFLICTHFNETIPVNEGETWEVPLLDTECTAFSVCTICQFTTAVTNFETFLGSSFCGSSFFQA